MGTLPPDQLLKLWEREELTVEQAIGHLLQQICRLQTALEAGNISHYQLRAEVNSLKTHLSILPHNKKPRSKKVK